MVELPDILKKHELNIPNNLKLIMDDGSDHNLINLSAKTVIIALFLKHNMDEIVACSTAARLLYRNLLERVHLIANLGLYSIELMRRVKTLREVDSELKFQQRNP